MTGSLFVVTAPSGAGKSSLIEALLKDDARLRLSVSYTTRAQDSDAVIRRRLASAEEEMSHASEFDYVIINKDFDEAKKDLQAVIRVERLRKARAS